LDTSLAGWNWFEFGFAPFDLTLRVCARFIRARLCFAQRRKANTEGAKKTKAEHWKMSLFGGGTCAANPSPDKSGA
jgi:hypothetical protein